MYSIITVPLVLFNGVSINKPFIFENPLKILFQVGKFSKDLVFLLPWVYTVIRAQNIASYDFKSLSEFIIKLTLPLKRQLEAVYDYFLKTPRIRFLLADELQ